MPPDPLLLYVGRLQPIKGLETLLEAMGQGLPVVASMGAVAASGGGTSDFCLQPFSQTS